MSTEEAAFSPTVDPSSRPRPESPRRSERALRLEAQFGPDGPALARMLAEALGPIIGGTLRVDRFSFQDRAAALGRPMAVVHLEWPRYRTRLGLGVDPPLAHALVDRLLGFERNLAELHLQVTPVEWGILGYLAAEGLSWLEPQTGPLGPWDLIIDRIGPGPFDGSGFGPIITLRWRVRLGNTIGSARLWVPWGLLTSKHAGPGVASGWTPEPAAARASEAAPSLSEHLAELAIEWGIVGGSATLPPGLDGRQLRVGKLVLLDESPLSGNPTVPTGQVTLTQAIGDESNGMTWQGQLAPTPDARAACLTVLTLPPVPADHAEPVDGDLARADREGTPRPLCLTVVIGRLRLGLGRWASLRPSDQVEVRETAFGPVELWGAGSRLATGELVAVDTELAVKITTVDSGVAPSPGPPALSPPVADSPPISEVEASRSGQGSSG